MPNIKPAKIDSHGNPGIAGKVSGVEIVAILDVLVVGVLTTVNVETEVLITVLIDELVDVTDSVDEDIEVLSCDTVEVVWVEFSVVVACCCCCPTVGGTTGSRWKMPVRVCTPVLGWAPTAQPSVGFVVNTEYKPKPGPTESGIGMLVHVPPFHHAVNAFPVLLPKVPVPL
jgi:hypothetical protein